MDRNRDENVYRYAIRGELFVRERKNEKERERKKE